jgi:hypothetical protein
MRGRRRGRPPPIVVRYSVFKEQLAHLLAGAGRGGGGKTRPLHGTASGPSLGPCRKAATNFESCGLRGVIEIAFKAPQFAAALASPWEFLALGVIAARVTRREIPPTAAVDAVPRAVGELPDVCLVIVRALKHWRSLSVVFEFAYFGEPALEECAFRMQFRPRNVVDRPCSCFDEAVDRLEAPR